MRFVLRARQNIPTGGDKPKAKTAKNEIRRQYHRQLQNLWMWTPFLKAQIDRGLPVGDMESRRIKIAGAPEFYGGKLEGVVFYPLVTYGGPWVVDHIDIRFLIRQDRLDEMDSSIGDIDGRLPVLFDALRIPHHPDQLIEDRSEIPNPCFCLLEDDSLVRRVHAETLHLLNDPNDNSDNTATPEKDHVVHTLVTLKRRDKSFSLFGS